MCMTLWRLPIEKVPLTKLSPSRRDEDDVVAADNHRAVSLQALPALYLLGFFEHQIHMHVKTVELASEFLAALDAHKHRGSQCPVQYVQRSLRSHENHQPVDSCVFKCIAPFLA